MDFIFDDDGLPIVCLVGNEPISRSKRDIVAIASELRH